jgi:hypothetical protein
MARFFEKLEAAGGKQGPQFLSDHPNPGNRMKAIQDLIKQMPQRSYTADSGRLARMKTLVAGIPAPKRTLAQARAQEQAQGGAATAEAPLSLPSSRPTGRMQQFQGKEFRISYPENWRTAPSQDNSSVTIAPASGVQQGQRGLSVGYGAIVAFYKPQNANISLWQATDELVSQLRGGDPSMRAGREMPAETRVGGKSAIITSLYTNSIFQGQTELDRMVTVAHPNGIMYIVLIAPEGERQYVDRTFDQMLKSVQFSF